MHRASWYEKPLDYQVVIYEANRETHVAKVTMNRPKSMNALSHQLRGELIHARKVVSKTMTSMSLSSKEPDFGSQYVGASHWARYLVNQYWQIWELSKIVIAQAHGYVLAGASELCTMCDLLVTTPGCQFGYPPVRAMPAPELKERGKSFSYEAFSRGGE